MTNEEIFKKLEAFAENRRDDCSKNGETHNTHYWVGYLDGLRRLYEKITDKEVTTNFEKIKSMTLEEMAESTAPFFVCPYDLSCEDCDDGECIKCTKEWLEREVKE
mgnify:CR=1 FL=1